MGKTVVLPFSEHGLTVAVMDSRGNVQIKTEELIPPGFEHEPMNWKKIAQSMADARAKRTGKDYSKVVAMYENDTEELTGFYFNQRTVEIEDALSCHDLATMHDPS